MLTIKFTNIIYKSHTCFNLINENKMIPYDRARNLFYWVHDNLAGDNLIRQICRQPNLSAS